jgi:hypothetical protein
MAQTGILAAFLMPHILLFSDHPKFSKTWSTDIQKKAATKIFKIRRKGLNKPVCSHCIFLGSENRKRKNPPVSGRPLVNGLV